jgi:site-specific recombinase XerD
LREQAVSLRRNVRVSGKEGWTRKAVPFETVRGRNWEQRIDTAVAYGKNVVALGAYYLCWSERQLNGKFKSCYEPAGHTYQDAAIKLDAKRNWLNVERTTQKAGVPTPPDPTAADQTLQQRMKEYLKKRENNETLAASSIQVFEIAFKEFLATTNVTFIEQVTAEALDSFVVGMKKRGRQQQTQSGYFAHVATFLRSQSQTVADLLRQYKAPKAPKKNPESYDEEDVDALLTYCYTQPRHIKRPDYFKMGLVAELLYKTGLRKKELSHLTWAMVDRKTESFAIKDNQQFDLTMRGGRKKKVVFRTKTKEDRPIEIPIEESLQNRLRLWRKENPRDRFLFPTANGNPDMDLLDKLRTVILHAGVNCGTCVACTSPCGYCGQCRCGTCKGCSKNKRKQSKCLRPRHGKKSCTGIQCKKWTLHKMRHTFLTKGVSDGADLKTLMDISGQRRLATVEKYLSVVKKRKAQEAINRVFAKRIDYAALPAASA